MRVRGVQVPSPQHVPGHLIQLVQEELTDACCPPKNHPEKSQACLKKPSEKIPNMQDVFLQGMGSKAACTSPGTDPRGPVGAGKGSLGMLRALLRGDSRDPSPGRLLKEGSPCWVPLGPHGQGSRR